MSKVDIKIKNGKVVLSTRISKGFDKNQKRIRNRYHLEVNESDYPTKESQLQVFNDYLISIGENAIENVEEKENVIQTKKNDEIVQKTDMEYTETNKNNEVSTRQIVKIPLSKIRLNEFNPYTIDDKFIERLANAIKDDGLNNPIHVVLKNGKYIVNKGNKRYLAYQLLNDKYGEKYAEIECYVIESFENNDWEILQLLRDNDNTYERTLIDKMKETELYHQIYPTLKADKAIKKGLRENEWIGIEMGLSDKSIKDYLKVIKNEEIKNMFYNDEIDTLECTLQLCDFYKLHGKKWFDRLVELYKQNYSKNGKISNNCLNVVVWNVEDEKRREEKKQEEVERKIQLSTSENNEIDENNENIENKSSLIEKVKKEEPPVTNINELRECCLAITEITDMKIEYDNEDDDLRCEVSFTYVDDFTKQKMYFEHSVGDNEIFLLVAVKDSEDSYCWSYDNFNKVVHLRLEYDKEQSYTMKEYISLLSIFTEERIKFEITEKKNFVYDLIPKSLKNRLYRGE